MSTVNCGESVDSSQAADSVSIDAIPIDPRYVVRIEGIAVPYIPGEVRDRDTVEISLNGFGKGIGGFDIKFGVDHPDFHILEVLPGRLIDSCGWEFFNPRQKINLPTSRLPLEVWQIIGLSQTIPDSTGPMCFGFDTTVSLIRLVVQYGPKTGGEFSLWIENNPTLPIFFYWEDCTDNTVSTESGDTLCVSLRVFGSTNQEVTDKRPLFPSRTGVPRQCINVSNPRHPHKLIDFYNGAITIEAPKPMNDDQSQQR